MPTPTKPVITSPLPGSTVDLTVTLAWAASTVGGGSDPPAAPDPTRTLIDASPAEIAAGGTSTVTIRLRDAAGAPVSWAIHSGTVGGTLGTMSALAPGSTSDELTATYTAGAAPGTAVISGTLNGEAITDTAQVTITGGGSVVTIEDFGDTAEGAGIPVGWAEQWSSVGVTTAVVAEQGAPGGRVLRRTVGGQRRLCLAYTPAGERGDVAVEGEIRLDAATHFAAATAMGGIALRAAGTPGAETAYVLMFMTEGGGTRLGLHRYSAGASTALAPAAFAWVPGTVYAFEFQVDGTQLRAKVWPPGEARPAEWTVTATDSTIAAAGAVGVFSFAAGVSTDLRILSVRDL